jgi:purine operon repressor
MRGQRTERLVRLASRFIYHPSKLISLTDLAAVFNVSKTVISDDVEVINSAMKSEGLGQMQVDRGRSGGARFIPDYSEERRREVMTAMAEKLSDPDRYLPGGLIYYSDLIFNPETAMSIGSAIASLFTRSAPDVVMTSEVKGIPIAMFAAHTLGVPLAVCRFRNRASDGPAVGVHYPTGSGDVKTMYIGTRQLRRHCRVLIVDDFMRGGGTVSGMLLMAKQFDAEVVGVGVFIAAEQPAIKSVPGIPGYKALLTLSNRDGKMSLQVTA